MEQINTLQSKILEHKEYLYNTDYVVIRSQESGEPISDVVKYNRFIARAEINRLELEIAEIEKQIDEQPENVQL